ncbi:hypothetical protein [Caulobacter sp.]|uniref:hypothetical protein n=1 Tax=Caulobacter sp. TaxID=78 RepID=UPI001B02CD9B|nr:hypothetical protein [Caulobacter sp.]MBO9545778.1 hypothetical protein [Caulobacter sp.]
MDLAQSDDFHDGNMLAIDLDLARGVLTCRLEVYLSAQTPRSRTPIKVEFQNVRNFSATADLATLREHTAFGNIAHWTPRKGFNLISLAAGAMTFEASEFEVAAAGPL